MAPKTEKVRRENAQVAQYLDRLYKMGNFSSWADFARHAGGITASTMSDWKRGENAPNGYNLLRLIWAAERNNAESLAIAALMTDPIVGRGIRIALQMAEEEMETEPASGEHEAQGSPFPHTPDLRSRQLELATAVRDLTSKSDRILALLERLADAQEPPGQSTSPRTP